MTNRTGGTITPNEITQVIVDTSLHIHRTLGPGLFESAYSSILTHELTKRGCKVEREVMIPVTWDGMVIEQGFRADLIVDDTVIVEVKSIDELAPVHSKQLLTYLKLADKPLGLLINFGGRLLKNGIIRIVNGLDETE